MELKRAFSSKGMLIVVLFSILLSVAALKGSLAMQKEYEAIIIRVGTEKVEDHTTYYPDTVFERCLTGNTFLPYGGIYYMLFPILAVLPFGTSYARDEELNYTRNILTRQKKSRYLLAKYLAAFVSGAGGFGDADVVIIDRNYALFSLYSTSDDQLSEWNSGSPDLFRVLFYSSMDIFWFVFSTGSGRRRAACRFGAGCFVFYH